MESSLALNANIRLKLKSMEVANTLAYYNTVTITAVKSFLRQAPGACTIKLFTAVIVAASHYATVFATFIHFHPSLIFVSKGGSLKRLHNGKLLPCLQILANLIKIFWRVNFPLLFVR